MVTIAQTIRGLDPHAQVHIDLGTHQVQVVSHASEAALRAALTDEGYPPQSATAAPDA